MMKTTDNFALAIRLNWVYYHQGCSLTIDNQRGKYRVTVSGENYVLDSEKAVFQLLKDCYPETLEALSKSHNLYHRGLYRRAELLLSMSEHELDERMQQFMDTGRQIFDTVIGHLGVTVTTKKLTTRPTGVKRGVSAWFFRANCLATGWPDKQNISVRYFPSPVMDGTWGVTVDMVTFSNEELLEFQLRMKTLGAALAEKGITLDDVTMCTYLEL